MGRPRKYNDDGSLIDPNAPIQDIEDMPTADETIIQAVSQAPDPSDKDAYAAYLMQVRQKRKPYGSTAQKLALPQRTGYKRHWFNDVGGRVQEHLDSGWSQVIGPDSKPVKRTVGSGRDNRALMAYALEIPSVFWEEVQAAQFREAQAKMDEIKKAPVRSPTGMAKASDNEKFYSPKEDQGIITVSESFVKSR